MRRLLFFTILLPSLVRAQSSVDLLESRLRELTGTSRIPLLVKLIDTYRFEDPAQAVTLGYEALDLLAETPDPEAELSVLNYLTYSHVSLAQLPEALELLGRAEGLARAAEDQAGLAFVLRNRGRVSRASGEYLKALDLFRESALLYEVAGDDLGLGKARTDTGIVHWMMGDYPAALGLFIEAHQLFESVGDLREAAGALNNIGIVHKRLDHPQKALDYYREALTIRRRIGPSGSVSNVLNNIGNVYKDLGEPAKSLHYYVEALEVGPADEHGRANTLANIGSAYQLLGNLGSAADYFKKSLALREAIGDKGGMAYSLGRIAEFQRLQGELEASIETGLEALGIAREVQARSEIQAISLELSQAYTAAGRYREALETFQQYESAKSEIFNEENSRKIAEMQSRFELDRKEKEIEILKQQQAIDALELARQATARKALLAVLSLLLLSTALLYNRYRLKVSSTRAMERKNRELKESEHRYHRLFDEPSTAKLLVEPESRSILDANEAAGKLLGGAGGQLVGQDGSALGLGWLDRGLRHLRGAETAGQATMIETFRSRDDQDRDFEIQASQLSIGGRAVALITLHDVTERRRLEEERVRKDERERYITELEAQKAEVEARNAEMERFVYTVSHDLKSPLVTIRGFLGLIAKDARANNVERMERDLSRVDAAAGRMTELLDDLLRLSQVGRMVNPTETVSMKELADEAVSMVLPTAGSAARIQVDPSLPEVAGDRARILEVLVNLLENALKFMGSQVEPRVSIGWRDERGRAVYSVQDNGIGIEPAYQELVFKLFERLDQEVAGTGVGLAIVKRIVEWHGGRIWIESEGQGRGSAFCFTLEGAELEIPAGVALSGEAPASRDSESSRQLS